MNSTVGGTGLSRLSREQLARRLGLGVDVEVGVRAITHCIVMRARISAYTPTYNYLFKPLHVYCTVSTFYLVSRTVRNLASRQPQARHVLFDVISTTMCVCECYSSSVTPLAS